MLNEQQNMALHRLHERIIDIVVKHKSVFVMCVTDPEGDDAFLVHYRLLPSWF